MPDTPMVIELAPGEVWWGGACEYGTSMPFGVAAFSLDLSEDFGGNQAAAFLVSSQGRYVWSGTPFMFRFEEHSLKIWPSSPLVLEHIGHDLRDAFRHAARRFFPASGTHPPLAMFSAPQYNTWIEMGYEPTQDKVLTYARDILSHGFPPGTMIIDDNWQEDYGTWEFHNRRFPQPKAMIDALHAMGFQVMLWICPFVSPDSVTFRKLNDMGFLVKDVESQPAIRRWWNGASAVLDGSNPKALDWLRADLDALRARYGIDGFKLDAGDPEYYRPDDLTYRPASPAEQCRLWSSVGLSYPYNELRASWQMGGQPLVQRLRDKRHSWDDGGLNTLIPNGIAQGLLGYPYICPDMVGGGLDEDLHSPRFHLDAELFVRFVQCSALFPMMQFSLAPWRVLDSEYLDLCRQSVQLHVRIFEDLAPLVQHAAAEGEPILRHMSYVFPGCGYDMINDQFMLGDQIMAAPILTPGATSRRVSIPPGTWTGDDGSTVLGPQTIEVSAPLHRLPWFRRQAES